jgi:hypothetical protein
MAYSDPADKKRYARKHYEANTATYKARAKLHTKKSQVEIRAWLLAYLKEHPCVDCGEGDPVVLEFDHREPSQKEITIGDLCSRHFGMTRIVKEVAKCDVRCANCHRRKTFRDRGLTHRD